jgi:short-subunit dehydrogenase
MSKRALITGASEGIGRALAERLAREGFAITALARTESRLEALLAALAGTGHRHVVADLADPADLERVCRDVEGSGYDLVVNNAGFGVYGPFDRLPLDRQLAVCRLNCEATVAICHAYLQTAKSGDALVNVSSGTAFTPIPFGAVYCGTKAFLVNFSEALWFEQRRRNVYVMALVPGLTHSKFHERAGGTDDNAPPKFLWEPADNVADTLVAALGKRREPTVYSNRMNKLMIFMARWRSRRSLVSMMGDLWEKSWLDEERRRAGP